MRIGGGDYADLMNSQGSRLPTNHTATSKDALLQPSTVSKANVIVIQ